MHRFIAYFDYLGFKDFIEKNDLQTQNQIVSNNLRDIEAALGEGKYKKSGYGFVADLSDLKINCINFSDTVVFYTNDSSEESLKHILDVSYHFNWRSNIFCFPVRGAIVHGEMTSFGFGQKENNAHYNVNSIYGKGLILAYEKANNQEWAGTVIDQSVLDQIISKNYFPGDYLKDYAKLYKVPYKHVGTNADEYVLNILKGSLTVDSFAGYKKRLEENFAQYKKSISDEGVQRKLKNTTLFLENLVIPI